MEALLLCLIACLCVSCAAASDSNIADDPDSVAGRRRMVELLRNHYRISDSRVLAAMAKVRRHLYIPAEQRRGADPYGDHPCPIGHGQTISQPFIVAYMTERMGIVKGEKVLEIGTGSGYQAAILSEMGARIWTIEIVPELADHARRTLASEGYASVSVLAGDGYKGWPEHQPFDAIVVTCAPEEIPQALVDQLRDGGRMILPLGAQLQRLVILRKKGAQVLREEDLPVRFVPMVHGRQPSDE